MSGTEWFLYILQCSDDTLYTGITPDLVGRLEKHTKGLGAKYTRGRGPFTVLFTETHATRGSALKREAAIKRLSREQKLNICRLAALSGTAASL